MRITVDLDASELHQATDFLTVLRDLARHADVEVRDGSGARPQRTTAPKQEPQLTPPADASHTRAVRPTSSLTPPPGQQPRATASQAQQDPSGRQQTGSQAEAQPLPSVSSAGSQVPLDALNKALQRLCASPDPSTTKQVSREVQDTLTRLKSQGADPSDLLYKALAQLVFDGSALQAGQSRLFLLDLVQGLQEPVKGQVFSSLTQAALGELTQSHNADADRREFLAQAEAFAGLITSSYIKVEGAIQTIASMLDKTWMRCAALTMLGKTIEHAHQQLLQDCNPTVLETLRAALGKVSEPEFTYDVDYAASFLGWNELRHHPSQESNGVGEPPADPSGPKAAKRLVGRMSMAGHAAEILAVAWHAASSHILTTDIEGCVAVWRPSEGSICHRAHAPGRKFSSMGILDVAGSTIVALAGLDSSGSAPSVQTYLLRDSQLHAAGAIPVDGSHITALAAAEESCVIVAGAAKAGHAYQCTLHDVRSIAASGKSSAAAAVAIFKGDHDRATCVTAIDQRLFACGTQSGKVAIWDQRTQSAPAQTLFFSGASPRQGSAASRGVTSCLSSVAAQGDLILGGSLGGTVALWDRRMVAGSSGQAFMELQPDAQPVSCVRFAPRAIASSSAVAATVEGLYMLNLEHNPAGSSKADFSQISKQQHQSPQLYKDLAWADPSPVLFCGGASTHLDIYNVS